MILIKIICLMQTGIHQDEKRCKWRKINIFRVSEKYIILQKRTIIKNCLTGNSPQTRINTGFSENNDTNKTTNRK